MVKILILLYMIGGKNAMGENLVGEKDVEMWKSPCKSRVFWEVDPPEDKKCGKISKKLKIRG